MPKENAPPSVDVLSAQLEILSVRNADVEKRNADLIARINGERDIANGLRADVQRQVNELRELRSELSRAVAASHDLAIANAELRGYIRRVDMDRPQPERMVLVPISRVKPEHEATRVMGMAGDFDTTDMQRR